MAHPGIQGTKYPLNIFNTWLDYRESKALRSDIIREVNLKIGRKHNNARFYRWKKQLLPVPEIMYLEFIYPELPDVLRWYFSKNGIEAGNIDFKALAHNIAFPREVKTIKHFFNISGFNSKEIDFELLSKSLQPAIKKT